MFLEILQNSQENICARVSFNFIKKEALELAFSCEFCKTFKNSFFHKTPLDDCFYMFYSNRQVVLWKLLIIYFFLEHFLSTVVTRFNYLKLIICYIYVNNRRHALSLDFDYLTVSWRRPLSYRNQSINLLRKSMDWFLYDNGLRHERVK